MIEQHTGVRPSERPVGWGAPCLLCFLAIASVAHAQPEQGREGQSDATVADERGAVDSPRASLIRFFEACDTGDFDEAARYLELPHDDLDRGPELARRLKAILDRRVSLELTDLSPEPQGDTGDGLPARTDELAQIPGGQGAVEAVRLVRRGALGRWLFSRDTVSGIDAWYARLDHGWLLERLPGPLLRSGPARLLYWQWIALPVLLILAWAFGHFFSSVTRRLLGRVAARTATRWDDEFLARLGWPLTLVWTLVLVYFGISWLALSPHAEEVAFRALRGGFVVALFWALGRSVDVVRQIIVASVWAKDHPASRSLLPIGARVSKVVVFALAVVAMLSELGLPVASLVAGLGIGGLAVALAAQKTIENLFGAVALGADQPFREGDFVGIEDFVGTIEAIGLRSTRIRTLDRTLITIPNGKLADMRLESYSERDRMRLACTLGLVYDTSAAQMRQVLAGLESVLREHAKIWPDAVVVRFKAFGASSLDVEIMAWFLTADFSEFQLIRQEVLLQFMDVVERAGTSFAFPTRTVHLVDERARAAEPENAPM